MSEEASKRLHVRVTGRVQGVCYRASTRQQAQRLNVSGWVRNTHDGAVEMEVQGAPAAIAELVTWCHGGPVAARVDEVTTRELAPLAERAGAGFEIRY